MILKHWRIVAAAVGILVLIALFAWGWERWADHKARTENARERASQARLEAKSLALELSKVQVELDEVRSRPPAVIEKTRIKVVTKYRDAPPVVIDYMATHKREIKWSNPDRSIKVHVPDALAGDSVEVKLDTDIICKSWIECCEDPGPTSGESPKFPIRWGPRLEIRGGYGYSGIDAEVGSWPIELGSRKFAVQVGGYARATMRPAGDFDGNAAIGVRVFLK
jgi:hypothetical protein